MLKFVIFLIDSDDNDFLTGLAVFIYFTDLLLLFACMHVIHNIVL